MAGETVIQSLLFKCVSLLCLGRYLCQKDCTGVDCPRLKFCIEEVLEQDACCATCLQTGCKCEGYQYYDCVQAGFHNGKVPEGESYFVDFGSTECSCPQGGGRITCHFIPCPDVPSNCIELSQPADGCAQCKRIGCTHRGQKFEAGHTFQMEPCQVCHCPNEGGPLMCYPIPNCDLLRIQKPMLPTPSEDEALEGRHSNPFMYDHEGNEDRLSQAHRFPPDENLPPAEEEPHRVDEEDYDYLPTDMPSQDILPTESSVVWVSRSENPSLLDRFDEIVKQELRERFGSHEVEVSKEKATDSLQTANEATPGLQETSTRDIVPETQNGQPVVDLLKVRNKEESLVLLKENTEPSIVSEKDVLYVVDQEHKHSHTLSEANQEHKIMHRGQVKEMDSNVSKQELLTEVDLGHKTIQRGHVQEMDSNRNNKDVLSEADPGHKIMQRGHVQEMDSNRNNKDVLSEADPRHKTIQRGHVQEMDSNRTNKDVLSEADPGHKTMQRGHVQELDSNRNNKDVLSEADPKHKTIQRGHVQEMNSNLNKRHNVSSETESKHKNMHIIHEMDFIKKDHLSSEAGREHGSMHGANIAESSSSGLGSGRDERHSAILSTRPETPEPSTPTTVTVKIKETKEAPYVHQAKEEDGQNALRSLSRHHEDVSLNSLVEDCCKAGQKWAEGNNHCNAMAFIRQDRQSVCRTAQEQCCLAVLTESSCLAAMNAAKAGVPCDANGDECGNDSYKECCSCCTLGMHFRVAGQGCAAHEHLSYSCGNIFLSCCEEDESPSQPALRRRQRPEPTVLPDRVSDSRFPNEAFSIQDREEAANSVEDLEDVDECQLDGDRLCHQRCINTWGSYECACYPGYTLHQDGHFCVSDNPMEDNRVGQEEGRARQPPETDVPPTRTTALLNACAENGPCAHLCSVEGGQAHCSCFPGFSLMTDGRSCEDVDECGTDMAICPRGDVCVNTAGSYQCLPESCQEGFILNGNRECVDVNECVTNAHSCQANEKCVNTMGSFMCQRQIICPAGYQARDGVCEDVDECALGTHNCGVGFECQNMQGSFSCQPRQRCFTGFSQDKHGNCVDVDECSSLEEPCSSGFNCINTVGSYTCQRKVILCSQGYHTSADGARCIDVDECQTGAHRCGEGQICQNLPGNYRCNCQTGYQPDLIRGTCVDINECWRYPGRLCAQTCENTPGSYRCTCTAGFSLSVDGKNCEDVNECNSNPCSQECANIYGSYQCYCRQGFFLKEDGHTCEDIDECSQSVGHLCAFKCVNVPGSYQCACPPSGYSMSPNGRTCRDIDECTNGAHNCSSTETCYNVQGGFRCLSFSCPANYRRVSDIRCERISCQDFQECQNMPLRITYYQLNFQTNIIIPALIFRIGPSPAYSGDSIIIRITRGYEENYFSTRKLNAYTGAVYLQRQVRQPRDFLIEVEMKLLRQGSFTTFLARIYVFITAHSL
uniref:Fibulin 2 n=1 Tax=Paramormyrops kingsleyae TaxID=1676925 RepID=A0A3B3RND3_9TELE